MTSEKPGEGFYVINKPIGITSFGVVHHMRRALGIKTIGHAGTLDPFASGVLVVAAGRPFTRQIDQWQSKPKTYLATMILGRSTETLDCDGLTPQVDASFPARIDEVEGILKSPEFWSQWMGEQLQTPPAYSAKKIDGKRAYKLARQNKEVVLAPVQITIHDIQFRNSELIGADLAVTFETTCSKGTYIRQLAADIAAKVGTIAFLSVLIRTAIGEAKLEDAISLEAITSMPRERAGIE